MQKDQLYNNTKKILATLLASTTGILTFYTGTQVLTKQNNITVIAWLLLHITLLITYAESYKTLRT